VGTRPPKLMGKIDAPPKLGRAIFESD
jgi:hypothetical protein